MPAAVETMFSAREVPWHGLGVVTDDVLTAADAVKAAGLDWTVSKRPLYFPSGDKKSKIKIPDTQYAIVRDSDDTYLGRAGRRYSPLQNGDAFQFMDNLVDSGDAKYETAGSLRNGRVIFITMKVPTGILIGGEDRHDVYILLRNTHDGSKKVGVYVVVVRVVCMNTLSLALATAQQCWEVSHVGTMEGRLQEARDTLQITNDYVGEFAIMGDQLINTKVTDEELQSLLETVLPDLPRIDEQIEAITQLYHDSPTNGYAGTGWGVVNAVTEFFDHVREVRSEENHMTSIVDGYISKIRNRTASLLLAK